MLVSTVVLATASLIPCHTIPLGDESCLALDCGSGGTTGTRKTFGNSITICLQPLTVKVASHGRNKKTVVPFFGSFISSMILIHVMLDGLTILHLFVEECLQYTYIRSLDDTSQHLIPVRNERLQILPTQLDTEQILKGIGCSVLDVGTKVVMQHEQHLSPSYNPSSGGFSLFEGIYLAGEVTSDNIGECRK